MLRIKYKEYLRYFKKTRTAIKMVVLLTSLSRCVIKEGLKKRIGRCNKILRNKIYEDGQGRDRSLSEMPGHVKNAVSCFAIAVERKGIFLILCYFCKKKIPGVMLRKTPFNKMSS